MGHKNGEARRFTQMRGSAASFVFPDMCRIYPPGGTMTGSGTIRAGTGTPLQYNGSADIPCRIDIAKHFRAAEVFGQEGIVSDFEIHVPWDAPLKHNHKIVINSQTYEITKLMDTDSWRVTKSALVARIGLGTTS